MFEVGQPFAEMSLETDDEGPAEGVDGVAMDERAAVGSGLDFVLGNVREGDAGDPLVALRQGVTVAVDKELKRLHEGVGLAGAGASFDEEALPVLKAVMDLVEGSLAGFLGRVHGLDGFNHRAPPRRRGPRRRGRLGRWPPRRPQCRHARATSIHRGCSRAGTSRCRRSRV